jgi:uncharacterized protein (TIGR03083 family)
MSATPAPRATVASLGAAARREAAALAAYARDLDPAGWEAPTWCPGWSVREIVAHLAEGMDRFGRQVRGALAGQPVEFSMPERNARRAEVKALPTAELIARLEAHTAAFFDSVERLDDDDLTRAIVPMAAGLTPILQVAYLRLYEPALHRWDVLAPSNPTATVDAVAADLLLDYALLVAPRQASREVLGDTRGACALAIDGAATRRVGLTWHDGALTVTPTAPAAPDATLHLAPESVVRLTSGRLPLAALDRNAAGIEGDRERVALLSRAFGSH